MKTSFILRLLNIRCPQYIWMGMAFSSGLHPGVSHQKFLSTQEHGCLPLESVNQWLCAPWSLFLLGKSFTWCVLQAKCHSFDGLYRFLCKWLWQCSIVSFFFFKECFFLCVSRISANIIVYYSFKVPFWQWCWTNSSSDLMTIN